MARWNNAATLSFVTAAFEGTINNTGMIEVTNTSNEEGSLFIDPAGATFEGEGTISLSYSSITGNAVGGTLTNVNNTIDGFGVIGDTDDNGSNNTLTLINGLKGVIDGSSTAEPLVIEATGSGELYIASRVTNSGTLISASGGDLVAAGAVSGGKAAIYGPGVIEFGAASSAATTFALGSTGELILDDAAQYTGTVSGFGKNINQSIDLSNVQFATASKTYSSGTLTVKDTAGDIAHIKLSGSYTLASFTLSNDGNGGTLINDPPVAKTTLTTGVDIALFGNYIASSLVGGSIGQGGNLLTEASALLSPPLLATPGHA
jgi:large repetitive protein